MLRKIGWAALVVFCVSSLGYAKEFRHFDANDLKVRNLLLEAFQSASSYQREGKLKEVLELDPENYYALVKLGELELESDKPAHLKANEYFLRAALAQPHRPEAYLALAQSYFTMGYVPEGTEYMIRALMGSQTRLTYEAVCLEGQKYLDTANYYAAVITYANAALSRSSPWRDDPHLLRKLYQAASLSDAPSFWVWRSSGLPAEGVGNVYWIPYVFAKLVSGYSSMDEDAQYRKLLAQLREYGQQLREIFPKLSPRAAEKLINKKLYPIVMNILRAKIGETETLDTAVRDRFKLSRRFFNFGACDKEKIKALEPDLNLYNVFIEASVSDPKERRALLAKLNKIRKEALAAVAGIEDPKKRGKALFKWLRENLLVKYDAVDGIPAEGVINKKNYLCLSGAILYTLIGRDAGLKVNGFLRPNHAFAVMYDKSGNRINVETTAPVKDTAESPAGFDIPDEYLVPRGSDLRGRANLEGEVSPVDLVSYQFTNVGINKIDQVMFNKYRDQLKEVLKEQGLEPSKINFLIDIWRHGMDQAGKTQAWLLMSLKYPEFYADMTNAIDEAIERFNEARSFSPFNVEFLNNVENVGDALTRLAAVRPASSMLKRMRQLKEHNRQALTKDLQEEMRDEAESQAKSEKEGKEKKEKPEAAKKETKTAKKEEKPKEEPGKVEEGETPEITSYDKEGEERAVFAAQAEGEETPQQAKRQWPREKEYWLSSLKRLEKLVKRYPCSARLKRVLLDHCILVTDVLAIAKDINVELEKDQKIDYEDLIDELNRIRAEVFDTQPEMAARLSSKIARLM